MESRPLHPAGAALLALSLCAALVLSLPAPAGGQAEKAPPAPETPPQAKPPAPPAPSAEDRETAKKLWAMGYLMHEVGEYRRAIAFYRASLQKAPSAEAYTFWAWSLSYLGEIDEAIRLAKKAIEVDPDFGNPYNDIGAYLIEKGKADEAVPWLRRAMRARRYCCPFFPHYNLGRIYAARGKWREALAEFRKALDLNPGFEGARKAIEAIQERVREL